MPDNSMVFTAPIQLMPPVPEMQLDVLEGILDENGNISVLYSSVNYEHILLIEDEFPLSRQKNIARGQFKNDFLYEIDFDDDDVVANTKMPILFTISNTGVNVIEAITVSIQGEPPGNRVQLILIAARI
jgi:hypothetical protein